jgi:hypothetical protein
VKHVLNQEDWQRKLDTEFPDGAIASWAGQPPDQQPIVYSVPRITVIGMNGQWPVLDMPAAGSDKVLDGLRVVGWHIALTEPHLIVIASLDGEDADHEHLRLCAAVSPQMKNLMAPLRAYYIALSKGEVPAAQV